MNNLVIGGAGFIGVNLSEKLLSKGEEVTVFDNFSRRGTVENIKWLKKKFSKVRVVKGNIVTDFNKLKREMRKNENVFHLAAQVAVTTSVKNPRMDFETNALGTFNVLEAARLTSNEFFLFSSTNKVYGGMEEVKIAKKGKKYVYKDYPKGIPETNTLDFHSPYGCSKGSADQYVRDYARIYGLNSVVLRQSCIYGPRQFGIEDQGWVAWFTIAGLLNKKITIYGDGMQVRDVLHVNDLVNAYLLARRKKKKSSGKIFNVGGGSENTMSLLELIDFLEKFLNKKIKYKFSDWRPGDQKVYVSDISKIKKELGWEPKINPKKGVEMLSEWVIKNKKLFEKW